MITLAENIGINILSNIVYDIAKNIAIQLHFKKVPEKSFQSTIQEIFDQSTNSDFRVILESSTFSQYFNSPQFLDVINAYLEHKLICDFANADAKIKKHLKKSGIIVPKDIVEYISENIHQMYIDKNVITIPTVVDIKKAVLFVLYAAEQTISSNLSPENTKITYLINARLDYHYQNIVELLQKTQSTIAATREIKLLPSYENHEEGLRSIGRI